MYILKRSSKTYNTKKTQKNIALTDFPSEHKLYLIYPYKIFSLEEIQIICFASKHVAVQIGNIH